MDWSNGYSARYYLHVVDPATWRDIERIDITKGMIKRELTGKRESADIDCIDYDVGLEQWVRIYLDAEQGGSGVHVPLFTGIASSPSLDFNGNVSRVPLACYSVLKPCEDVALPLGWYAPAGARGSDVIRRLLSVTPAPTVIADNAPALSQAIIAENKETHLTMIDKILGAINWRIRISGDGTINVLPKADTAVAVFDPLDNDMIETSVKVSADWYSAPNVYRATTGDITGIARDESPDSPLSIGSRGREVGLTESGVTLAANESVAQYARRKLAEAQRVMQSASYTRRYLPDVVPGDLIQLHYPRQQIDGIYSIKSQSITLSHGASTAETVTKE